MFHVCIKQSEEFLLHFVLCSVSDNINQCELKFLKIRFCKITTNNWGAVSKCFSKT